MALEEAVAMLKAVGAPAALVEKFTAQAEAVYAKKGPMGNDEVTITSGFGQTSQQGFVELTLNDQRSQMDVKKAREIGLMLIQGAEAASSDAMFVALLKQTGMDQPEAYGQVLLALREIRQGTREVSWPS
jgi:hypothetical protein